MQVTEEKATSIRTERNYGIDILKIISIFMVIILHVLGQGGVLNACEVGSTQYYMAWLMESLSYCAVNCFAMTTGYLMIDKSYRTSRIIPLWFQVSFYSILFTIGMELLQFNPDAKMWFKSFFPVSTGLYWYFSAYFCLFFMTPFINKVLTTLSKRQFTILCSVLVTFFSIINMARFTDVFATYKGYDVFWLAILYVLGAYVKQCNIFEKVNNIWFFIVFIASSGVACISYVYLTQYKDRPFRGILPNNFLLTYTSPLIVLAAFAFLLFCIKIELNNKIVKKVVVTLSSLSFGVYIIHLHKLFWNNYIKNAFVEFGKASPLELIGKVILVALVIYLICSVVEWLRIKLFKLFRIDKLSNIIGNKIDSVLKLNL